MVNFAILALLGPIQANSMLCPMGICGDQGTCGAQLDSHWVPHRTLSPVSTPPWRYALTDTYIFGSFLGLPNNLFWDPNSSPPCGQLAAPYLYAHDEPAHNFKSCP